MRIMKFGGSSVRDAERIRNVCAIITEAQTETPVAVVSSAMKGITDLLIESSRKAAEGDDTYKTCLETIRDRKWTAIQDLFEGRPEGITVFDDIAAMIEELGQILHGVELVRDCSPRSLDLIMSFGERMNCKLIAGFLNFSGHQAAYIDARKIIRTDETHGNGDVDMDISAELISKALGSTKAIPIITGFVASSESGVTTTLGRNGSDYTAAIIGNGLDAGAIEIWTDVDGVLSADPRLVDTAFVVPDISFQEAMELSFFGAEVIHPYTMIPAVEKNIPVWIKNTMNPHVRGTRIARDVPAHGKEITGIASISDVALINVEGGGMIGRPGIAGEVFTALAEAKTNVIMISQASSEHSICLVCRQDEAARAVESLKANLTHEIRTKKIQNFELISDLEILSVIGENMRGRTGISGRLFSSLGDNNINVLAIAQGSSERNISFVIHKSDAKKALNLIHKAFLEEK